MAEGKKVEGFDCLVDSEHKSTQFKVFSFAAPHMRAFHLNWFGFFTAFVSVFAPAAMIPVIRECIGISAIDLGNAGALLFFPGSSEF
jgi:MFS transporter, NNP family, nitrate/nitrite transporter